MAGAPSDPVVRRRLVVRGVVQGVGFRPHVARLARELALGGRCRNDATCVVVELEGPAAALADFERRLRTEAPPLARIMSVESADVVPTGERDFTISGSTATPGARTMVPPDSAVCEDCLREMRDPADRRYRHAFITCTNCGPRFTITLDLPYDRPVTTMAAFPMCGRCAGEYADPADRRYHAQPIACHDCGPTLTFDESARGEEALAQAVAALRAGRIVAIKGIGGFHLACAAGDARAVAELRRRKRRPDQPFALMAADLAVARRIAVLPPDAADVLAAPERPILLLPRRESELVADAVAPGLAELGVMLPYAPLHHLLLQPHPDGTPAAAPVLVMTSGNLSGEPLCFTDEDARSRLAGIADHFLSHDREIAVPCEDSVLAWDPDAPVGERVVPVRRSRGYAPLPVALPGPDGASVLAAGAELKNTVALARDRLGFVSAHLGDLDSLESRAAYRRATAQMLRFHRASPALVVADLHPGYLSRAWAAELAAELDVPLHDVQHHHAHLASLAAEHGRLEEDLLGVVFDGTGYGCDATIWGGELLVLTRGGLTAERVGHLGTVRLPGGDAGVRNPVRQAGLAMLAAGVDLAGTPVAGALSDAERALLPSLLHHDGGWVATSSVGRLFDVVAAMLGVRPRVSYEAQAAIELEVLARTWRAEQGPGATALPLPVIEAAGDTIVDPDPLVRAVATAQAAGDPPGLLAWSFHVALAGAAARLAGAEADRRGLGTVGLTGGVFANRTLLGLLRARLEEAGLEVLTHRLVPANDGGLALGQVAVGLRALQDVVEDHEGRR
ncbi:MAG TPA: carbamoyltransferase HypF [Nocardioides sp.]|uniref:carbamoyltransferase HypF n=1 Tax=Nocardioides sp. TaxID=35761 RepID=UPI002BEB0275|nr:carbamoyltransferase HypF [Nocardioides sp.]HQR27027.1 carbamoyltransferase HypF [Nocardioides sp.]